MKLSELEILEAINEFCDDLFSCYIWLLLAIIVGWTIKTLISSDCEEEVKQYNFKKRSELLKWKKAFIGRWENISRDGFYEVRNEPASII